MRDHGRIRGRNISQQRRHGGRLTPEADERKKEEKEEEEKRGGPRRTATALKALSHRVGVQEAAADDVSV